MDEYLLFEPSGEISDKHTLKENSDFIKIETEVEIAEVDEEIVSEISDSVKSKAFSDSISFLFIFPGVIVNFSANLHNSMCFSDNELFFQSLATSSMSF